MLQFFFFFYNNNNSKKQQMCLPELYCKNCDITILGFMDWTEIKTFLFH